MSDLSPFYLHARRARETALDAEAGRSVLAQFGYGLGQSETAPAPGESQDATGVKVQTDPAKIDTSKVPGQRPRQGPAPKPQQGLKLEGTEDLDRQAVARQAAPDTVGLGDGGAGNQFQTRLTDLVTEFIANTDDPARYQRELVEIFKKDPRELEAGLQQLLVGAGLSMPFVNSVMHLARKSVQEAGGSEGLATAAELIAAIPVPSRMALGLVPGAARMSTQHGAAALLERGQPQRFGARPLPRTGEGPSFAKLGAYTEATQNPESFQRFMQRGQYVILSAEKQGLPAAENAANTAELLSDLLKAGYHPIPAQGMYGAAPEGSFFVPGMPDAEGLQHAGKFKQESILSPRGLVYTADESVNPADLSKIDFSGAQEDYFTSLKIGDQDVKFTVPIDFDTKIPRGGVVPDVVPDTGVVSAGQSKVVGQQVSAAREADISADIPFAKDVEAAGARFDGVSDIGGGKQGVWFTDPQTGSTLLMNVDEVTPENVALHLAESRKAWGIAPISGGSDAGIPRDTGVYAGQPLWHLTEDPNFTPNAEYRPPARGGWDVSPEPRLYASSDVNYWKNVSGGGMGPWGQDRKYAAEIELLPGHPPIKNQDPLNPELALDPRFVRVRRVVPIEQALHEQETRAWKNTAGAVAGAAISQFGDESDPYAGTALGMAIGVGTGNLKLLRAPSLVQDLAVMKKGGKLFNALVADGAVAMLRGGYEAWGKQMLDLGVPEQHLAELLSRSKEVFKTRLKKVQKDMISFEDAAPFWDKAEGRADWYAMPATFRQAFGPDTELITGLAAALSPGRPAASINWDAAFRVYEILKTEPKAAHKQLISELRPGGEFGMKSQLPNVWRAIEGKPLSGNKVSDFHMGLLGDESVFPIDRHGARMIAPKFFAKKGELDDAEYALLSDWGKQFAQNAGVAPRYAQQRLWIGYRLMNGLEDAGNDPFFEVALERAKAQGVLDLVPKLIDDDVRGRGAAAWVVGAVGAGALTGAYTGDTLEEQLASGLATAGILAPPKVVRTVSQWLAKNAHNARNLVRKPLDQYPPDVAQRLEKLFTGYEADLNTATRGTRPHSQAWSEAEQMIGDGRMDLWSIKHMFPGQTMNDTEAMALLKVSAEHLDETRAFAKSLQQAIDGGKPLTPEQVDQFLTRLYEIRELLPKPRGVVAEAGRTLSAMNEPSAGLNAYLAQWQLLFTDPAKGMSPDRLVDAIAGFRSVDQHLALAHASQQPGFADMAIEALYGALLGPMSLAVNGVAGVLGLAWAPIERTGMAFQGGIARLIGEDARTVTHWAEPFAALYGYATALPMAFANARRAFMTGERTISGGAKIEGLRTGPVSGVTSQFLEQSVAGTLAETAVPLAIGGALYANGMDPVNAGLVTAGLHPRMWPLIPRGMAATDELLKTMLFEAGKWSVAVRRASAAPAKHRERVLYETVRNPNALVRAEAERLANEFTMTTPSPFVEAIQSWAGDVPGPYRVFLKTVAPFMTTPIDLVKFASYRTLGLQQLHTTWWSDLTTPGVRQDKALGSLAMGAAAIVGISKAAAEGVFVGSGPADPNLRDLWLADGNQEYSMRIGNKTFSINRMDPWGQMVSIIADWSAVAAHIDDASNDRIAAALLMVVSKDMMSKSYLEGWANVLDAVTNKDPNQAYRWLHQYTGTPIPSLVKGARAAQDPYLREVRDLVDAAMNKVPDLSKKLSMKKNIFADPIINHEPIGYGIDHVQPFRMKTLKNDPATKAVLDNKISVSMPSWQLFGDAAKNWTLDPQRESVGVPLTHELRDELIDLIGKPLKKEWLAFVQSDAYDKNNEGPDSTNALVFKRLHRAFREAATKTLVERHPELLRELENALARRAAALETQQSPRPAAPYLPSLQQRLQRPDFAPQGAR